VFLTHATPSRLLRTPWNAGSSRSVVDHVPRGMAESRTRIINLQHFFRLKSIATAVPKRPESASSSSSPQELMVTTLASCADCR